MSTKPSAPFLSSGALDHGDDVPLRYQFLNLVFTNLSAERLFKGFLYGSNSSGISASSSGIVRWPATPIGIGASFPLRI
jgi:hypothetical protein